MDMTEAFAELVAQVPSIVERGYAPLYFWEPDQTVPVSTNLTEADRLEGWDHIRAMEDIALAYLVVAAPHATGQTVIYAKWPLQGWSANPWCKRHLIRHVLDVSRENLDDYGEQIDLLNEDNGTACDTIQRLKAERDALDDIRKNHNDMLLVMAAEIGHDISSGNVPWNLLDDVICLRKRCDAAVARAELAEKTLLALDGIPCRHPGCFNHVSHPCEGCGRIAGRYSRAARQNGGAS
ncbi:MAG TPA: hypothetical protein PKC79_18140 [Solidesulfovibrio magneticus]|nr:hypothetical protein [Solidesulfovibrio magneticus]